MYLPPKIPWWDRPRITTVDSPLHIGGNQRPHSGYWPIVILTSSEAQVTEALVKSWFYCLRGIYLVSASPLGALGSALTLIPSSFSFKIKSSPFVQVSSFLRQLHAHNISSVQSLPFILYGLCASQSQLIYFI